MSRELFGVEKGLRFYLESSDSYVDYLVGQVAPDGLGDQASAPIGSLYQRIGTGELYQKIANAGAAADWELNGSGSSSVLPIFSDKVVRAATGDALAAGSVDPTGFSDNEGGLDGTAFAIGEYLIGGVGGTPVLYEVTAVNSATDIVIAAVSPAMQDNDGFVVRSYLPDSPADQENTAGVMYQNGNIVKLFDVDWSVATAISLSAGYSPVNGVISIGDSVEVAIEKLDGNQQDLQTLVGVPQGSTDLGSFTGATIPDGQDVKEALQSLETAHEEVDQNVNDLITLSGRPENSTDHGVMDQGDILSDGADTNTLFKEVDAELTKQKGKSQASGVTTATVIDSVLVDEIANAKWLITVENAASPANKKHFELFAGHDGHASADAVSVDDTLYARLRLGTNFNASITVDLSGVGAAQVMQFKVASTAPSGVNVYAKRVETEF